MRELDGKGFGLAKVPRKIDPYTGRELSKAQFLNGSYYFIFFAIQIIIYALLAYLVERYMWGVSRHFDRIESTSDVAVRCTGLSKTL